MDENEASQRYVGRNDCGMARLSQENNNDSNNIMLAA